MRCLGPGRKRVVRAEEGPDTCNQLWEQERGSHGGLVRASAQGTPAALWGRGSPSGNRASASERWPRD